MLHMWWCVDGHTSLPHHEDFCLSSPIWAECSGYERATNKVGLSGHLLRPGPDNLHNLTHRDYSAISSPFAAWRQGIHLLQLSGWNMTSDTHYFLGISVNPQSRVISPTNM